MQKAKRLLAIEKILLNEKIYSQEALLRKLKGKGIMCTQATLSRNLRQLGVSRVPDGKGGTVYSLGGMREPLTGNEQALNFNAVIRDIIEARGFIVMKTVPGNANATAYYIDNSARYEIAGTIAGDDTILIIPRDGITTAQVRSCLEMIMPGLHNRIERKLTGDKEKNQIKK